MDQVLFATGIYGLSGSILILFFHLLPDIIGIQKKGQRPFFIYNSEKELRDGVNTYKFFSHLWSFRLIGTGFIIMIIYSLFTEEYLNLPYNIWFVVLDTIILTLVAIFSIEDIHKEKIGLRNFRYIFFYFGFSSVMYIMLMGVNSVYYMGVKIDFIDNILLLSAFFSQITFSGLLFIKWKVYKLHEQLKIEE